ncbi:ABC transporter ATP-binding protein [Streptomyces sp. CLV115]|uniref:ABC transporter ATP-binding protein n=1 Tax=Streptomyces sp. CLV115 TaxID=3138502 RepID=UPI00313B9DD3
MKNIGKETYPPRFAGATANETARVAGDSTTPDSGLIHIDSVSQVFVKDDRQRVEVLDSVSLTVSRGEFIAIVGPSGCGKSSLLNLVSGLISPTQGTILYDGQPIDGVNHKVGYMTQHESLLPWQKVRANIELALRIKGVPRAERARAVDDWLDLVGLSGFGDHYPAELSGGMRRRTALARTLIYGPETVLMDEPFGALDAQLRLILQAELLRLRDIGQQTYLFVTHDLEEAISIADRVIVMSARPARIKHIQEIPFGKSRDIVGIRHSREFGEIFAHLWQLLKQDLHMGSEN